MERERSWESELCLRAGSWAFLVFMTDVLVDSDCSVSFSCITHFTNTSYRVSFPYPCERWSLRFPVLLCAAANPGRTPAGDSAPGSASVAL